MTSGDNPFVPPVDARDPVRRFRGRLASPVTIVTSGSGRDRAGLTVGSLFLNEGEPGRVHMVVGPLTDLWDAIADTERCIVHIARASDHGLAEVFAGLRPSPGGPFADVETADTEWGPVLADLPDRVSCRMVEMREEGWSGLVVAEIEQVGVSENADPLIHFRGRYRRLA